MGVMTRAVLVVVAVLACCPVRSFAQGRPIALTEKITSLEGVWIRDPAKGVRGSCANTVDPDTVDQTIRIRVSRKG